MAEQIGRFRHRGESLCECDLCDGQRDMDRHLPNARQGGINPPQLKVILRNLPIQRFGGRSEHFIGHAGCLRGKNAQPDAGEDITVIRLTRHKGLTVHHHRRELAAAGEDGALIREAVGLFSGAFRLGGRV